MWTKKTSVIVISIITFILVINNVFSSPVSLEENLDLNHWVELLDLSFAQINDINLKDFQNQRRLSNLKDTNQILKNLITMKYRNWDFNYYQMSGIVKNYTDFTYYSNKYFEYLKLKEQRPSLWEIDYAISKNYRNMRESYKKVVQLID